MECKYSLMVYLDEVYILKRRNEHAPNKRYF